MADLFIDTIVDEIQDYSDDVTRAYGWTVVGQNSPARREWDETPLVIVTPQGADQINMIAFGSVGVRSSYDVFLVNQGGLANDFTDFADNFLSALIDIFIPTSQVMKDAGAYLTNIKNKYGYDRTAFPQSYIVSCCTVEVSFDKKDF